jgi:HNH endonuclease
MEGSSMSPRRQTTAFGFSIVERCLLESLGRRQFGDAERAQAVEFFGEPLQCVYCGSSDVTRWDHLIAVRTHGETVLGNMVPACGPCDDSKARTAFEEWMLGEAPRPRRNRDVLGVVDIHSRIEVLHAYMRQFHYTAIPINERLNPQEYKDFNALIERLGDLRGSAEELIRRVAVRAGARPVGDPGDGSTAQSEAKVQDSLERSDGHFDGKVKGAG